MVPDESRLPRASRRVARSGLDPAPVGESEVISLVILLDHQPDELIQPLFLPRVTMVGTVLNRGPGSLELEQQVLDAHVARACVDARDTDSVETSAQVAVQIGSSLANDPVDL